MTAVRTDYRCRELDAMMAARGKGASLLTYPSQHFGFSPVLTFKPFAPSVRLIGQIAAQLCEVTFEELLGRRKSRGPVRARCMTVWVARKLRRDLSYQQIAKVINRRDHTTLVSQFALAERLRLEDLSFLQLCDMLVARVSAEA